MVPRVPMENGSRCSMPPFFPSPYSYLLSWFQLPTCILTATNSGPGPCSPSSRPLFLMLLPQSPHAPDRPSLRPSFFLCFLLQMATPPWPRACFPPAPPFLHSACRHSPGPGSPPSRSISNSLFHSCVSPLSPGLQYFV